MYVLVCVCVCVSVFICVSVLSVFVKRQTSVYEGICELCVCVCVCAVLGPFFNSILSQGEVFHY